MQTFFNWKLNTIIICSNLTSKTSEILFEVWDGGNESDINEEENNTFLGLGIVSVEELQIASTSRHVIPLQGRPYFNTDDSNGDNIHGLLTVEFVLIEKKYSKNTAPLAAVSRNREQGKNSNLSYLTSFEPQYPRTNQIIVIFKLSS